MRKKHTLNRTFGATSLSACLLLYCHFLAYVVLPVRYGFGAAAILSSICRAAAGQLKLTVLHSMEPGAAPPDCELVPDPIRSQCAIEEVTQHGDAAGAIIKAVQDLKPDLIVMGAERKRSALGEIFSSTTEKILQWATVPLLVVPGTQP